MKHVIGVKLNYICEDISHIIHDTSQSSLLSLLKDCVLIFIVTLVQYQNERKKKIEKNVDGNCTVYYYFFRICFVEMIV